MAAGAVILGCAGPELGRDERAFFAEAQPWGFILFDRNARDPAQLARLCGALRDAVGRDAPVLIDQEGGRVQRLWPPHWRAWLPPLEQAGRAADPARSFWLRSRIIAHELRACGIDVNCAPCADVARAQTHPFLRNRCLGSDPGTVARLARAVADGLLAGGVLPVTKHLPGHGLGRVDSHHALPVVRAEARELRETDFAPFRALADLPMAMTAHVVMEAFDTRPATQSATLIRAIREEIGFGGLLMTDDISMQALAGDIASRAAASIAAGCDMVLHCNGDRAEMEQAVAAAGTLRGEAAARAEAALARRRAPDPVDPAALEAELDALLRVGADE